MTSKGPPQEALTGSLSLPCVCQVLEMQLRLFQEAAHTARGREALVTDAGLYLAGKTELLAALLPAAASSDLAGLSSVVAALLPKLLPGVRSAALYLPDNHDHQQQQPQQQPPQQARPANKVVRAKRSDSAFAQSRWDRSADIVASVRSRKTRPWSARR